MNWVEKIHDHSIHKRRVEVLSDTLARMIPDGVRVLDIGSGDGWLCALLAVKRPDLQLVAVDTFVREQVRFPVTVYDGEHLPFEKNTFDVAVFIDVLHHVSSMRRLLDEALRVTRQFILIKDHYCGNPIDRAILKFMDSVSNEHLGVSLTYNYKSRAEWAEIFAALNLEVRQEEKQLHLYPPIMGWLFERSLHFVALLEKQPSAPGVAD